jgi:CRISPR/Cas system-associated exonuclease Cas4 (RecB family)
MNTSKLKENPMANRINAWSVSRLHSYEKCPYQAYLSFVKKIKTPEAAPLKRGTEVHTLAEQYIKGEIPLAPELEHHTDGFTDLRKLYDDGLVNVEAPWGLTTAWTPTGFFDDDTFGRIKIDALVIEGDTIRVIDFKTGKKHGNEIKHADQGKIYALAASIFYPDAKEIVVEFWYLDIPPTRKNIQTITYDKNRAKDYVLKLIPRIEAMTSDTTFKPKPNKWTCKFCPYSPTGTGDCYYAAG